MKSEQLVNGDASALPEMLQFLQQAVEFFLPLREISDDPDEKTRLTRRITNTLAIPEKCIERIPTMEPKLLASVADACEQAFLATTNDQVATALARAAIAACLRARLNERAAAIAREGSSRITNPDERVRLNAIVNEFEHRQRMTTQFKLAQQAIADGRYAAAYPALVAAIEQATALDDAAMKAQLERLLDDTRLRDPELSVKYLDEIRALLITGDFDEAERQIDRIFRLIL